MSDFIIQKHEIVRFINDVVQKRNCNCPLIFNISEDDSVNINAILYCIIGGAFSGDDISKDCESLRVAIKEIASCCIKKQEEKK